MDGPLIARGALLLDGLPEGGEGRCGAVARSSQPAVRSSSEPADLLLSSYPQVPDDSKPPCTDHLFTQQGAGLSR